MFESLAKPPIDPILALGQAVRSDPRADRLDLGIGVYRDETGLTPIMKAVSEAERRLLSERSSKTYVGARGDTVFVDRIAELVLGRSRPEEMAGIQATGGTGALRVLAGLVARANTGATVWLPGPSWSNHETIFADAGLRIAAYPYYDPVEKGILVEETMAVFKSLPAGDVVLLHGCCHNPCGVDLSLDSWRELAIVLSERGLIPLIDLAYQGFGRGLEEDAQGVRELISEVPELMIAFSGSKNFGLYSERTGCALVVAEHAKAAGIAAEHMALVARPLYSMPPDHGSAIVRTILESKELSEAWRVELEQVRLSIVGKRRQLTVALRDAVGTGGFDYLEEGSGMFSLLDLSSDEVMSLRREKGIYVVGDGRINVAGLPADRIADFAFAIDELVKRRR
ncbi:aspartate/tyrosine/aromatic aminotransferase [Brucella oryzae]|uniref:amino acid aminotransferase n=1 Tax=Brucella oryzae TaxID=335286 RepID=UPI001B83F6D2|nr:amino acid aminotransferase [Brucella oryzae]MBR7653398.1 aspartate/tyrosine/aromatic aminotransferase [Brucella oryzae]